MEEKMGKAIIFCSLLVFSEASAGPEEKINQALFKSYIAAIKNSIGARTFRQLYLYDQDADRVVEVLQNGNLACAYFVSSILLHFGLLDNFYVNVEEAIAAMKAKGWRSAKRPVPGAVIIWAERRFRKNARPHKHIGFYIGPGRAVSNSSRTGYPVIHNLRPEGRKIIEILFYPKLY